MNILVLSWRDPKHPLAGGAEQVMHEHMKGWVEAGHTVALFASKMPAVHQTEEIDGIKIIRGGYQYLGVQIAAFFYYLKNRNKIDYLVDQFHGFPFFTPLYSNKPKLAVLQEVASKVWFLNPLPFPINYIIGSLGYLFEPFIFIFYRNTHFMTGSVSAKKDLIRFGIKAENITPVPHGVLVHMPKPFPKKEKKFTVIYLGALSKDKGVEDALICFKFLSKYNYNFWIVGKPETKAYFDKLKYKAKQYKVNAKFWGFVSQKKKFKLLARSHVLVNPSVHEGWGLVNIEANTVGTPVVACNSAGLVDSVKSGKSGVIVKNNTPQELAKTVVELLGNQKKYDDLQKGALKWSKNFSWEKSKKLSLALIEKLRFKNSL